MEGWVGEAVQIASLIIGTERASSAIYTRIKIEKLRRRDRMGSIGGEYSGEKKPHAVCIPYPAQGHINAMLKLAKLLHFKGFHITFVHTEFNYKRVMNAAAAVHGSSSFVWVHDFRFEAVPDGSLEDGTIEGPFRDLLKRLNNPCSGVPPVTCIVSDSFTSFTAGVAKEFEIPDVFFCPTSACGFMGFYHYKQLVERQPILPPKSEDDQVNGYLDTVIDWMPGMPNMRLRDLQGFHRTTDPHEVLFIISNAQASPRDTAIIDNNSDDDQKELPLDEVLSTYRPVYPIGPLNLPRSQTFGTMSESARSSQGEEDSTWMDRLEGNEVNSDPSAAAGEDNLVNGYLDTVIDWMPGMPIMRLRDLPCFLRTTDPDEVIFIISKAQASPRTIAKNDNSSDDQEELPLDEMSSTSRPVYPIGPLNLPFSQTFGSMPESTRSSLGKEDSACLDRFKEKEVISAPSAAAGKDDLMNGCLDIVIDWMPGMPNMRLRYLPRFLRTTDPDEILFIHTLREAQASSRATAIIVNSFDDLEGPVLKEMSSIYGSVYPIGPLNLLCSQTLGAVPECARSSRSKEDSTFLDWLERRKANSVIYVNFGSLATMTGQQLTEFAWGLANSGCDFLWVIRSVVLPKEFLAETSGRGFLASSCPHEDVLRHPSIGGFLSHCGWNSTMEALSSGVPMICWPFFADQQTNCRFLCIELGVGMEVDNDVKREKVEEMIRELLGGEKGKAMRINASQWKESAIRATKPGGKSLENFEGVVKDVLSGRKD